MIRLIFLITLFALSVKALSFPTPTPPNDDDEGVTCVPTTGDPGRCDCECTCESECPTRPDDEFTTSPTTEPPFECPDNKLDVCFALDMSHSIRDAGAGNWQLILNFVATVIGTLPVSSDLVRVGIVRFASRFDTRTDADMSITDPAGVLNIVQNLPYEPSNTDPKRTKTNFGLAACKDVLLGPNARPGEVPQAYVIVTDGKTSEPALTQVEVDRMRECNVSGVAVGVGDINEVELVKLTTRTDPPFFFYVDDFSQLPTIQMDLSQMICDTAEDGVDMAG